MSWSATWYPDAALVCDGRSGRVLLVHPDPFKTILLHVERQLISDETMAYYERQLASGLFDQSVSNNAGWVVGTALSGVSAGGRCAHGG